MNTCIRPSRQGRAASSSRAPRPNSSSARSGWSPRGTRCSPRRSPAGSSSSSLGSLRPAAPTRLPGSPTGSRRSSGSSPEGCPTPRSPPSCSSATPRSRATWPTCWPSSSSGTGFRPWCWPTSPASCGPGPGEGPASAGQAGALVVAVLREGQDAPGVVLGDPVGHLGHRRVALGRRLVEGRLVVLDELVVLRGRVVEDLERLARRAEPRGLQSVGEAAGPVLAVGGALHRLDERPVRLLLGGLLVHGQLGQRKCFEPLVGDRPAAQDRAAVGARGQAVLGPPQRLQTARQLPGHRLVGLLQGPPVGAVDEVLGSLVGGGDTVVVGVHRRQEQLEPMALLPQEGTRPLLVHPYPSLRWCPPTGPWEFGPASSGVYSGLSEPLGSGGAGANPGSRSPSPFAKVPWSSAPIRRRARPRLTRTDGNLPLAS